jgi:hypothetical protein
VKIGAAPNNGWYTVRLAHFAGTAVEANFNLLASRYNAGKVNCAGPTPPAIVDAASEAAKAAKTQQ